MRRGSSAAAKKMAWVRSFQRNGGKRKKRGGRPRSNYYSAGMIANPPSFFKRARTTVKRYAKRFRGNPAATGGAQTRTLMGIPVPALEPLGGAVLGFIVPPVIQNFIAPYIPVSISGSTLGRYAIRTASVILPAMLVRKLVNQRVGNYMIIAGVAKIVVDAVSEFAPGVIPGMSGYLGYGQPFLGEYTSRVAAGASYPARVPQYVSALNNGVPNRLAPNRF
jgi:hypothetical protein